MWRPIGADASKGMAKKPISDEFFVGAPSPRTRASRRWVAIPLALAVVIAGAGFFLLRSTQTAEAYAFRYAFETGDTRTYEIKMDMHATPVGVPDVEAMDGSMRAILTMSVVEARPDGSAVVDMEISDVQMTPPQPGMPAGLGSMRVTIGPDGAIRNVEGTGGLLGLAGLDPTAGFTGGPGAPSDSTNSQLFFPQFPEDAVAPGDSWTESTTFPLPFGDEEVKITANGQLVDYKDTAYGRAAFLNYHISSPMTFEFSLAELFEAMLAFAESAGMEGGTATAPPPEVRNARFVFSGDMAMVADMLVLPESGDLVQLDGTVDMNIGITLEGVPPSLGAPGEFSVDAEMRMSMTRIDGITSG